MKFSRIISLLFLLALLPTTLSTQQFPILLKERELIKWPEAGKANPKMAELMCGEYFMFVPTHTAGRESHWRVCYRIKKRIDDPPGLDFLSLAVFFPETLRLRIDASKKIPTAELVLTPEMKIGKVIIRIAPEDYDKSSCLEGLKKDE